MIEEAFKRKSEFNLLDPKTGLKVDFWVMKGDAFDKLRLKRGIFKKLKIKK